MGCTYCGVTLLWALLVWATWSAECYPICGSCWLRFHKTHVFKILCALLLFNIMFESFLIWKKNALVSVVF